jgi:hypothetical protein
MPLTAKGEEIKSALEKEYGKEHGDRVLYAGKNKGTFTGIDSVDRRGSAAELKAVVDQLGTAVNDLSTRFDAFRFRKDAHD